MNISPFQPLEAFGNETPEDEKAPLLINLVPAGFPSPAEDYVEEPLNLHNFVVHNPAATVFAWAAGDSMIGAGIYDGDLMVIDRSITPSNGKAVVATLDGGYTVKRYKRKGNRVWLEPANPDYEAIEITDREDAYIWGVVTFVLHKPEFPAELN